MIINKIRDLLQHLRYTPLHPQWIANRGHRQVKSQFKSIQGECILDIGSGDNPIKNHLSADNQIFALDYPQTANRYRMRPNIYGDVTQLPFREETFDSIVLLEVLEHVANDRQALQEIFRTLKPQGKLFISIPFCYPMHDQPYDFKRYTKHGLIMMLEQTGFAVELITAMGNSLSTSLQLTNLALLDMIASLARKTVFLALLTGLTVYPIILINNLIAGIFSLMPWHGALNLGFFSIASKNAQTR